MGQESYFKKDAYFFLTYDWEGKGSMALFIKKKKSEYSVLHLESVSVIVVKRLAQWPVVGYFLRGSREHTLYVHLVLKNSIHEYPFVWMIIYN